MQPYSLIKKEERKEENEEFRQVVTNCFQLLSYAAAILFC